MKTSYSPHTLRRRRPSRPLDSEQARICLELWASKRFDTLEISHLLRVKEDAIARTIQAARDMTIILYREECR